MPSLWLWCFYTGNIESYPLLNYGIPWIFTQNWCPPDSYRSMRKLSVIAVIMYDLRLSDLSPFMSLYPKISKHDIPPWHPWQARQTCSSFLLSYVWHTVEWSVVILFCLLITSCQKCKILCTLSRKFYLIVCDFCMLVFGEWCFRCCSCLQKLKQTVRNYVMTCSMKAISLVRNLRKNYLL